MARCPICGEHARERSENRFFPFCTERCKLVDLGKWLSGDYRVRTNETPDEDDMTETTEEEAKH